MAQGKQTEILLESGTNEIEIMEFTIAGQSFGINVAKVTEIMKYSPLKAMQNAQPYIEGIFKPRDEVITVVDLAKYLNLPPAEDNSHDIFVITHFNQMQCGFHVHTVEGIARISWSMIQKPDKIIYGGEEGVTTGIAEYDKRLISILDFERIISEINPDVGIQVAHVEKFADRERTNVPILIAEDSMLLSKLIVESLHKSGYKNTFKTNDGQEAWDLLCEAKSSGDPVKEHVACLVTDIEMPRMDGHHLTRLVKEDSVLKAIPVIIFSSLITEAMYEKGKSLGADEQLSKPQIASLVSIIDRLTNAYSGTA